jgi:acid soluble protein 1
MPKRVRLTQRTRQAVESPPLFPGDVGNENRPYKEMDKYDNWQEVVNHPLPDMRTEWKDNPRNEEGFGIPKSGPPTVASVKMAASKAVRLAVLLLGDKTDEAIIENQARDFIGLSDEAMDRTLARFAETFELYEEQKEAAEEKPEAAAEEILAQETSEEEPKEAAEETPEKTEETPKESADEEAKTEDAPKEAAEAAEEKTEVVAEEPVKQMGEMDIELTSAMPDEPEANPEEDAKLAQLFADPNLPTEKSEDSTPVEAAEKQGVKKLGGQPKVASTDAPTDLSQLWKSAPDVSEAFN